MTDKESALQQRRDVVAARMPSVAVGAARKLETAGGGSMWTQVYDLWQSPVWESLPSFILSGMKGCGKTTAMVGLGCREIMRGRYVWYVPVTSFTRLVKMREGAKPSVDQMRACQLLLLDQMHLMDKLPGWSLLELIDVIDYRYSMSGLQTGAAGTLPEKALGGVVGMEIMDRFDVTIDSKEQSYR
jgi:DNA replication protein DnaC